MRKLFIGTFAVALALGTMSFVKNQERVNEQTYDYYRFTPAGTNDVPTLKSSGNWTGTDDSGCGGSSYVCKIRLNHGASLSTYLNGITTVGSFTPNLVSQKN